MSTRNLKRRQAKKDAEVLRALCAVTRAYNCQIKSRLDRLVCDIQLATNRQLDALRDILQDDIDTIRRTFGIVRSNDEFVQLFTKMIENPAEFVFPPKWLLKKYLPAFDSVYPRCALLPEHTRLSLDVHGRSLPDAPGELRLIEAALFEDMASLFNRALRLSQETAQKRATKSVLKESAACRRGAVASAFFVVEAYLNSLAFDHLANHGDSLSTCERDLLSEWDSKRNRVRYASFRDKLIDYPRMILGLEHPPLQENNCAEMAFMLQEAKAYRNAIVHASPVPTPAAALADKERRFWQIGLAVGDWYHASAAPHDLTQSDPSIWIRIIDTSIALLRILECRIHGSEKRLFWLSDRRQDGFFDDSVFE